MKATAKDLRFNSKELLDTVKRGEEVLITYRGEPCAKIVPLELNGKPKKDKKRKKLFGLWKDKTEITDVDKYVRDLRKGRF